MGVTQLDLGLIAILLLSSGFSMMAQTTLGTYIKANNEHWIIKLASNLLGYSAIFLPCFLAYKFLEGKGLHEKSSVVIRDAWLNPVIQALFIGKKEKLEESSKSQNSTKKSSKAQSGKEKSLRFVFCCVGLQLSYLTWGVLQEKIMTRQYQSSSGHKTDQFKDSQFLVFVNRVLGFCIASLYLLFVGKKQNDGQINRPPLFKYSFCSLSNIMSSWFQYEALKFVTFPSQVLAKASKIIPVMVMGKIISRKKYLFYEYVVAALISLGMVFFLMDSGKRKENMPTTTTLSGIMLLSGYMVSDAFTSNWQKDLFDNYKMSSMEMMQGVNIFSALLTFTSLFTQGTFQPALIFMISHPMFAVDSVLLSICSASGQLFIFHTIEHFGPVIFTIIMTLRQAFAIMLSCYLYGHTIGLLGKLGISAVFSALALKIVMSKKVKK